MGGAVGIGWAYKGVYGYGRPPEGHPRAESTAKRFETLPDGL